MRTLSALIVFSFLVLPHAGHTSDLPAHDVRNEEQTASRLETQKAPETSRSRRDTAPITPPYEPPTETKDRSATAQTVTSGTQRPADSISDEATTIFTYVPGAIYTIYCKPAHLTDIQFQPGEELLDVKGGDTARWKAEDTISGRGSRRRYHVAVRPSKQNIETNLLITTDRHSYHLKAVARNWHMPSVAWQYPQDEQNQMLHLQREQERLEQENISGPLNPEHMNFNYKVKSPWFKSYDWQPKMVFDDGAKTYIQMGDGMKTAEAPVLFVKDGEGKLNLVNYRVKNAFYIVDRLFTEAELRNGKDETVTIKNLSK